MLVLDLLIERLLPGEMPVSGQVPGDVVGQAGQDLFVVTAAEAVEIPLHQRLGPTRRLHLIGRLGNNDCR